MPTPINSSSAPNQSYDPGMSIDDGTGGASNAGYEGGARGAGNAPPSRPAERTDDRCFMEAAKTTVACAKLIMKRDALSAASCAIALASLSTCVKERVTNPQE